MCYDSRHNLLFSVAVDSLHIHASTGFSREMNWCNLTASLITGAPTITLTSHSQQCV